MDFWLGLTIIFFIVTVIALAMTLFALFKKDVKGLLFALLYASGSTFMTAVFYAMDTRDGNALGILIVIAIVVLIAAILVAAGSDDSSKESQETTSNTTEAPTN